MLQIKNYKIDLINQNIRNRIYYDVQITNENSNTAIIKDYSPSPFITEPSEQIMDALRFITSVAIEWMEDERNDDNDDFFEKTYNQLSKVMSNSDIEELYYLTHENEE